MHVIKGQTRSFTNYHVSIKETVYKKPKHPLQRFFWWLTWLNMGAYPTETIETQLEGVVEADDQTGLIIKQEFDKEHRPIFTDGKDDIVLDNPVKLLLLTAPFRQAFHQAGFKPKLVTSYYQNVRIRYEGPPQTLVKVEQAESDHAVQAEGVA